MKNYYEILEVDRHASISVIKGVYKIHIKNKHPDLFSGEEKIKAEEELKELNEAYETLIDERKRYEYDQLLDSEEQLDKELFEQVVKENTVLKEILNKQEVPTEEVKVAREYVPNSAETHKNNVDYLMHMIWKERIIKVIIILAMIIAITVGIYKASGVNIIKIIFDAFVKAF